MTTYSTEPLHPRPEAYPDHIDLESWWTAQVLNWLHEKVSRHPSPPRRNPYDDPPNARTYKIRTIP